MKKNSPTGRPVRRTVHSRQGRIPIGIASSPVEKGFVKFTVNRAGVVTTHLHNMREGDLMGLRGPLGNCYPWDLLEGKNILIVGGGFAFTTLRSSIVYMLDPANRSKFGNIDVVYGARSPGMLLYKDELVEWEKRDDINMHITVDGTDDPDWKYNVGFVPPITEQKAPPGRTGYLCHRVRSADHDQVHPAGAGKTGLRPRSHHHELGKPHEMRVRHVRPLRDRQGTGLQGRAGIHPGSDQSNA